MNPVFRIAIWLVERVSPSPHRHALCGDLLQQAHAGRGAAWLARELLFALSMAVFQRFGRIGIPLLFSAGWSALYRGYASPQLGIFNPAWAHTFDIFPLRSIAGLLLQIAPVDTFLWFGLGLFLCVRRDVLQCLTIVSLALALSASHAALLVMIMVWPRHHGHASLAHLLMQRSFYLGWINLPVTISLLVAILCVLPKKSDPPRRRRRARVAPLPSSLQAQFPAAGVLPARQSQSLRSVALVVAFALVASAVSGQSPHPPLTPEQLASIDTFITHEMQQEHIPGLAVGVYSRDALTVAVLTNLDSSHARPALFTHRIAGLIQGELAIEKLAPIADDDPGTTVALRRLLDSVVASRDVREQVSPQLAKVITRAAVTSAQAQLAPVWPGGTLTLVRRGPMPQLNTQVSLYRLQKGGTALLVAFARDAEGKAAFITFHADSEY